MISIIEMFNVLFSCDYDNYDEIPNVDCIDKVIEVCYYLRDIYELIPDEILPFVSGGLCIFYERNDYLFLVEVHNDLDIDALVNDNKNKSIIKSADIVNFDFCDIVKTFKERVDEKETN